MKILHFDYDDFKNPYAGGGQAVTTLEIYSRMSKKHQVTVVTGNYPGATEKTVDKIHYKRLGFGNYGPKVSLLSFWFLIPFYVLFNQSRFDIIVEFFTAPFSSSFVPFFARKPLLAWPTALFAKDLAKKYNSPFQMFEEFGIKHYENFVASTEEMKTDLLKTNQQAKIDVIPYGFDKKLLKIRSSENRYGIYVGRIDLMQKGIDILIKAWALLIAGGVKMKLVVIGNGKPEDEKSLKLLIKKLKIEKFVELKGRVFGSVRDEMVSKSLLVVCPSRYETYCIMALEAMAMEKPLLYSEIKGFSWVPKDLAFPFKSESPKDLAKQISYVIQHKKERLAKSSLARRYAADYEWDSITRKYERLFLKVISNK